MYGYRIIYIKHQILQSVSRVEQFKTQFTLFLREIYFSLHQTRRKDQTARSSDYKVFFLHTFLRKRDLVRRFPCSIYQRDSYYKIHLSGSKRVLVPRTLF